MALIDLEEFKSVLGIGDIYADEIVQEVADAAEEVILSYLTFNQSFIGSVKLENNVATYFTTTRHNFAVGASVVITGCRSPFSATKTITEKGNYYFKVVLTNANVEQEAVIPTGRALLASQSALYDADPAVREAALAVGVDIWVTRQGTLGQQGVDFQPAPYRLGRSIMTRVSGLLAKHLDVGGMIG